MHCIKKLFDIFVIRDVDDASGQTPGQATQQTATPVPLPSAVFTVQSPFAIATPHAPTIPAQQLIQPVAGASAMSLGMPTTFVGQLFSESEG